MKDFQVCLEQVETATDGLVEFLIQTVGKG